MWFKVLSIDRLNNSLRVECHSINGYTHEEDWDDQLSSLKKQYKQYYCK